MSLSMEYNRKIKRFIEVVPKRMYKFCEEVCFQGFVTKDRFTYADACAHQKKDFAEGMRWGKKWEYGWFLPKL